MISASSHDFDTSMRSGVNLSASPRLTIYREGVGEGEGD